jgi:DivIVA domain-containing protein
VDSDAAGWAVPAAIPASVGPQPPESAQDSEVDGAILAEWIETRKFSTTRLRPGYDEEEVDAFLDAIRDTFLGTREPSLTPEEIRNKQFSTTRLRPGYNVEEVDAFLGEAELRLAAQASAQAHAARHRSVAADPAVAQRVGRSGPSRRFLTTAGMAAALVTVGGLIAGLDHSWSSTSTASSPPQSASSTFQASLDGLQSGDCLTGSNLGLGTDSAWPDSVTVVPCTQRHTAEVFFAGNAWPQSMEYPGDNAISDTADNRCETAFDADDGVLASDDSIFTYNEIIPDSDSWPDGDRWLACVAYKDTPRYPGGAPVDYSIKGSHQ